MSSSNAETSLLVYPSNGVRKEKESGKNGSGGSLQIFNCISLVAVCSIQAHRAAVIKVAFNPNGSLLATASDKGTIIRVFNTENGQKLHQFRRGTYPALIYSLTFNPQSTLLCVTSDSDTVHIFKLVPSSSPTNNAGLSAILPERVGEALESVRDWAHLKLPSSNLPSLCTLGR